MTRATIIAIVMLAAGCTKQPGLTDEQITQKVKECKSQGLYSSAITWGTEVKRVFCTYPAPKVEAKQ